MRTLPVVKRFARRKSAVFGLALMLFVLSVASIGPLLCSQDPYAQDISEKHAPPSSKHWLGTDYLGRDMLSRMVYGARVSIGISLVSVLSGCSVGIVLGLISGYFGNWVDQVTSGLSTVLLSFPGMLLAMVIVAVLGRGVPNTVLALAIGYVPWMCRIVRGLVVALRSLEFIDACRVVGASSTRIIFRHVMPNCISQILVNITLLFGTAILGASALSFLGLGVQAPNPEWGAMLNNAKDSIRSYPEGVILPGIAITMAVMGFSLFGDGLRDALDPRLKNR